MNYPKTAQGHPALRLINNVFFVLAINLKVDN